MTGQPQTNHTKWLEEFPQQMQDSMKRLGLKTLHPTTERRLIFEDLPRENQIQFNPRRDVLISNFVLERPENKEDLVWVGKNVDNSGTWTHIHVLRAIQSAVVGTMCNRKTINRECSMKQLWRKALSQIQINFRNVTLFCTKVDKIHKNMHTQFSKVRKWSWSSFHWII